MSEILTERPKLDPQVLADKWRAIVFGIIDHAFEPIVNIHTGATFGYRSASLTCPRHTGCRSAGTW